jgi:L-serine dehydratase
MAFVSILNDVLGPVMRGPSSSHTAGSYHIGRLLRSALGGEPARATFTFDPEGSYAATYRQQGVDRALVAGLLGWPITDRRFARALDHAARRGFRPRFRVAPLKGADHPNTVDAEIVSKSGRALRALAKSVGGGMVLVTKIDGRPVRIDGKRREELTLAGQGEDKAGTKIVIPPLFHVQKGKPLFASAGEMIALARRRRISLGRAALAYEARLLGLTEAEVVAEIGRRLGIMKDSVRQGLSGRGLRLKLMAPTAGTIFRAEAAGELPAGGFETRAAARAMAALHVAGSGGVVCAAPTGGSAGVLPGVMVTLEEEKGLDGERAALALLAAGAVGLIVARRATFAAEVAGCQVEIGVAGAMAAAAVVEAAGGSAVQAADAAAISLQNTMGSVCDLVQGLCEIPCHTRNAAAAASAFVCADLVCGGYRNPVPLDETIDASFAAGRMLPSELRCTAKGGLAMAPSALGLGKKR